MTLFSNADSERAVRLDYGSDADEVNGRQCALVRAGDGGRVEISLHDHRDAETFCLVALGGREGAAPERKRCMGPFHSLAQGQGAMKAIVAALLNDAYAVETDGRFQWELMAARLAKEIRETRIRHRTDTTFVPLGVPPENPD